MKNLLFILLLTGCGSVTTINGYRVKTVKDNQKNNVTAFIIFVCIGYSLTKAIIKK